MPNQQPQVSHLTDSEFLSAYQDKTTTFLGQELFRRLADLENLPEEHESELEDQKREYLSYMSEKDDGISDLQKEIVALGIKIVALEIEIWNLKEQLYQRFV